MQQVPVSLLHFRFLFDFEWMYMLKSPEAILHTKFLHTKDKQLMQACN